MEQESEYMEQESECKTNPEGNVGANIRLIRNILGIKQYDLALQVGISQQMVSHWEQQRVVPKNVLVRIAAVLNVPVTLIENMKENPLSIVIENNTFENGSYVGSTGVIENDQIQHHENQIHPIDKIMELNKETSALYERMLALEKEKSALLEKLLNEKK